MYFINNNNNNMVGLGVGGWELGVGRGANNSSP